MLLYSLLHLTGVKAVSKDYENMGEPRFRWRRFGASGSSTAAAPDTRSTARWTSGVETTTSPLGQGLATNLGMAMASR